MGGHDAQLDKEEREALGVDARFYESCVFRAAKTAAEGAVAGFLLGAAKTSWYPDPLRFDVKNTRQPFALDVQYIMRGIRGPVLWSSLICATYGLTECVFEGIRDPEKESTWVNSAAGGAAAGLVMGGITKRFDIMSTCALGVGTLMGLVEYNAYHSAGTKQVQSRLQGVLPPVVHDSDALIGLKEHYPEFKKL